MAIASIPQFLVTLVNKCPCASACAHIGACLFSLFSASPPPAHGKCRRVGEGVTTRTLELGNASAGRRDVRIFLCRLGAASPCAYNSTGLQRRCARARQG
eukprot:850035-Pleurochrysis_carterae.AAC.2